MTMSDVDVDVDVAVANYPLLGVTAGSQQCAGSRVLRGGQAVRVVADRFGTATP